MTVPTEPHRQQHTTSQRGQMSSTPASPFGRSGNPKGAGANPELVVFEPLLNQTDDFKIDTCHTLAWRSALLG